VLFVIYSLFAFIGVAIQLGVLIFIGHSYQKTKNLETFGVSCWLTGVVFCVYIINVYKFVFTYL
jgi:hypothetical protein